LSAIAFALRGPQCLGGPFAALDPLIRSIWLDNVGESMPLLRVGVDDFIAHAGYAAIGSVGALLAFRAASDPVDRVRWITVLALGAVAAVLMLMLTRTGSVAHAFATPGAAYLARELFVRARKLQLVALRAPATAVALIAGTPAILVWVLMLGGGKTETHPVCNGDFGALAAMPPSLLYAPLDIGPEIIVRTPHSVIATGHHRNHVVMSEVIRTFTGTADAARANIEAHHAGYVVLCANAPEMKLYTTYAPHGFAAQLVSGHAPGWLAPMSLAGMDPRLLVYRVDDRGVAANLLASDER
jgi:hypothetical protein